MSKNTEMRNPVGGAAADPWVIRQGDRYYCVRSTGKAIVVSVFGSLTAVGEAFAAGKTVWQPPENTPYSCELWAPELHYLRGEWYIYVACDDGNNETHRMYVLKGTAQDPTEPFVFCGKIADKTDKWAIDGTVLTYENELYFIWSGWEGDVNVRQNLYITHMADPLRIDGERVRLSVPELPWEKNGTPLINEGPEAVVQDGVITLLYSASGSWTDEYCLGALVLRDGNPLRPESWEKCPVPVLSKAEGAYGPGHGCITTDGTGNPYLIYHANLISGSGWDGRSLRMQPVLLENGEICPMQAMRPGESFNIME